MSAYWLRLSSNKSIWMPAELHWTVLGAKWDVFSVMWSPRNAKDSTCLATWKYFMDANHSYQVCKYWFVWISCFDLYCGGRPFELLCLIGAQVLVPVKITVKVWTRKLEWLFHHKLIQYQWQGKDHTWQSYIWMNSESQWFYFFSVSLDTTFSNLITLINYRFSCSPSSVS